MTFRVGLFGLDKWHHVPRTVAQLEAALDRLGIGTKTEAPAASQNQAATSGITSEATTA
jgi:aspartate aminotransferase-like enzyme